MRATWDVLRGVGIVECVLFIFFACVIVWRGIYDARAAGRSWRSGLPKHIWQIGIGQSIVAMSAIAYLIDRIGHDDLNFYETPVLLVGMTLSLFGLRQMIRLRNPGEMTETGIGVSSGTYTLAVIIFVAALFGFVRLDNESRERKEQNCTLFERSYAELVRQAHASKKFLATPPEKQKPALRAFRPYATAQLAQLEGTKKHPGRLALEKPPRYCNEPGVGE